MATRQEVFDLIQKQMAQRAAIYNSAVAVQTKPAAKRFADADGSSRKLLYLRECGWRV